MNGTTYSWTMVLAATQLPENIVKMNMDRRSTVFRPNKSLDLATMIMKLVYVSRYAVTTQLLWLNPLRSSVIDTREVLTIDISRLTRKVPK